MEKIGNLRTGGPLVVLTSHWISGVLTQEAGLMVMPDAMVSATISKQVLVASYTSTIKVFIPPSVLLWQIVQEV